MVLVWYQETTLNVYCHYYQALSVAVILCDSLICTRKLIFASSPKKILNIKRCLLFWPDAICIFSGRTYIFWRTFKGKRDFNGIPPIQNFNINLSLPFSHSGFQFLLLALQILLRKLLPNIHPKGLLEPVKAPLPSNSDRSFRLWTAWTVTENYLRTFCQGAVGSGCLQGWPARVLLQRVSGTDTYFLPSVLWQLRGKIAGLWKRRRNKDIKIKKKHLA